MPFSSYQFSAFSLAGLRQVTVSSVLIGQLKVVISSRRVIRKVSITSRFDGLTSTYSVYWAHCWRFVFQMARFVPSIVLNWKLLGSWCINWYIDTSQCTIKVIFPVEWVKLKDFIEQLVNFHATTLGCSWFFDVIMLYHGMSGLLLWRFLKAWVSSCNIIEEISNRLDFSL